MLTDNTARKLDQLAARCSRFSGWALLWCINKTSYGVPLFRMEQPGQPLSTLTLMLNPVCPIVLHEVYGRMRHWAVTPDEQLLVIQALNEYKEGA